MTPERTISQRGIVGKRIAFADSEVVTKYIFPFVDSTWEVPFVVVDGLGMPPRILADRIHFDGRGIFTSARIRTLRPIESIPTEDFAALVHFDPWWAFRGVSGVSRAWQSAIVATNIAHPFHDSRKAFKIHDLRFSDGMDRLEALVAKDDLFHVREFRSGELDLRALRGGRSGEPRRDSPLPPAKVL